MFIILPLTPGAPRAGEIWILPSYLEKNHIPEVSKSCPSNCAGSCVNRGCSVRHTPKLAHPHGRRLIPHTLWRDRGLIPMPFFGELPSNLAAHS